ncbi:MAG: CPBP family intramembrane metalloprotease [Thermoproteota archaeon]|nr:CPBP family intramembrane metalloprotease [Thermoproteota archaeon]NLD65784.1 CPBP family intramembrane metalloprotease [Thermoproteota archaeon]
MENNQKTIIATAWVATLLASSLDVILWKELTGGIPYWLPWIHVVALTTIFVFTLILPQLRSLRNFTAILLIIFLLGFGGGWQWGLIPYLRETAIWVNWETQAPWALSAISTHLLRLLPALIILVFLLFSGRKRSDLFLVKGNVRAPVEPSRLLGMKKPEPWTRIGTIFAVIFASVTLIYLALSNFPSLRTLELALPLIPVAILIAAINAFNEEFTLRAAPLSELKNSVGKHQGLMITTLFFGLGHFYGVPSGVLGVLLASFLGWFLGKSMLETKGFIWAWLIHFLPDVFIFTFFAFAVVG